MRWCEGGRSGAGEEMVGKEGTRPSVGAVKDGGRMSERATLRRWECVGTR